MIKECMRCSHPLKEVENINEYDVLVQEYKCPNCGCIEILYPCCEEDKENYPYYNENMHDSLGSSSHGYDGLCPQCGSHIVWAGDFMRSEILGDVDEDDLDEYGLPKDDSLASNVFCPHCGASIDVIEAKPSEYHLYSYYKDN